MTETILIIILSVIAIILAAGFVKQFLGDNKEKLLAVLKDTGYENNGPPLTCHAKIIRFVSTPELANFGKRNRYVDYNGILFEMENGEYVEFEVSDYDCRMKYHVGQTGTLYYYEPNRFIDFKLDDTPENRARMFL